jgi:hypothetical protein
MGPGFRRDDNPHPSYFTTRRIRGVHSLRLYGSSTDL